MARLSKAQHFEVYNDSRTPTAGSTPRRAMDTGMSPRGKPYSPRPALDRHDSKYESFPNAPALAPLDDEDPNFLTVNEEDDSDDDAEDGDEEEEDADADADDERRESTLTSTSISTMPDSVIHTDFESPFPATRPYTPPSARPPFRRAESVRRMQMTSPTPFDRSPRRSVLTRSRPGTPRSNPRSIRSPKTRRPRIEEEDEDRMAAATAHRGGDEKDDEDEDERRDFPLVLLHLTLLPVDLPWSAACMAAVLPRPVQDSLQTLRAKVSETILQRGILVPHPREDYELLEERLLEALELRTERLTKCGHFRARGSTSTISSAGEGSVDSGHGSSIEGSDSEMCDVCCHRVKTSNSGVGPAGQRWTVKVFAANGLMRAAAWAAAWPEMERVDVEIVPWISDEFRKMLDAKAAEEEAEERRRAEEEQSLIRPMRELTWMPEDAMTEMRHSEGLHMGQGLEGTLTAEVLTRMVTVSAQYSTSPISGETTDEQDHFVKSTSDLPPIYRPSEIPLSLLLRNYVFLLAQDARNVAILALTMIAVWLSIHSALTSASPSAISPVLDICPRTELTNSALNATMSLFASPGSGMAAESVAKEMHPDVSQPRQDTASTDETGGVIDTALTGDTATPDL